MIMVNLLSKKSRAEHPVLYQIVQMHYFWHYASGGAKARQARLKRFR